MVIQDHLSVGRQWLVPGSPRESIGTQGDVAETLVRKGAEVDRRRSRLVIGECAVVEEYSHVHRTCISMHQEFSFGGVARGSSPPEAEAVCRYCL